MRSFEAGDESIDRMYTAQFLTGGIGPDYEYAIIVTLSIDS
jgi:hypothetical protein